MKQKSFYVLFFAALTAIKLLMPFTSELHEHWCRNVFGKNDLEELAEVLCRKVAGFESTNVISASELPGDGEQSGA